MRINGDPSIMAGETLSGDLTQNPDPSVAQGQNRLSGVSGIAPTLGDQAQTFGPQIGVHPDVALQSIQAVKPAADLQARHDVVANSAPVRQFVNGANDAQVASVQDDLPSLARIGAVAGGLDLTSFSDIVKSAGAAAWRALQQSPYAQPGAIAPHIAQINDVFSSVLAEAAMKIPQSSQPIVQSTPEFRYQAVKGAISNALFSALPIHGLQEAGIEASKPPAEGAAPGPTPVTPPSAPPSVGPEGRWTTTPEGFVADAEGNPVSFNNQKSAGVWAMKQGYASGTDQIFSVANGPEGQFHVQETARTAPPVDNVPPVGVHPGVDNVRGIVAEADSSAVSALQREIAGSDTLTRNPQVMEEYLQQQVGDRTVSIDPDKLVELAQQGHEPFPDLTSDILSASKTGTDVEVPLAKYLAATSGQPFADDLNAASTFRDGGTSTNEAKEQAAPAGAVIPPAKGEVPNDLTPEEASRAQTIAATYQGELQQVVAAQYLEPLFKDPKAIGMTADQFGRYSNGISEAVQEAADKMHARVYAQIKRERTPEWKETVAQKSAEVEQALAQRPDLNAWSYLTRGKGVLGEPVESPFKLDSNDPLSQHGKDLGLPDRMFSKNGVSPDEAAEVLGFPSGAELIRSLEGTKADMEWRGATNSAEHLKELVKEGAEVAARSELGFDITPEDIHAAASEIVNSPKVEEFLSEELRTLAQAADLPFDLPALKQFAKDRFDELIVKDALNIRKLESYVYKGGVKAEKALLKGDIPLAFARKQQQFIHHLQLAQAHKFGKVYSRATKQFRRWAKSPTLPNVAQEYTNYVHAALVDMGYAVKRNTAELVSSLKGVPLADFINVKEAQGQIIVNAPLPTIAPEKMAVGQFNGVWDTLQSMVHNGREEESVYTLEKREDMEALLGEIGDNFDALGRKFSPNRSERSGVGGTLERTAQGMNAPMIRMEQLLDEVDRNNPRGPMNRAVVEPTQAAKGHENDMLARVTEELNTFAKAQPKSWLGTMKTKVDAPELRFTRGGVDEPRITTRGEMVRAALNWGNPSNKAKLLEGYGWDEPTVQRLFDREMSKADWDFVQKIWDIHESLWPEIETTYRAVAGIPPAKIEPVGFRTPHGEYAGGYFPLSYDKLRGADVRSFSKDSIWGEEYNAGLPANPYTHARTGYIGPLALNFDGINAGIGQTVHDIAFRQALLQAQKVLTNPEVIHGIQETFGPSYAAQLRPWLEYAAREQITDDTATDVMASIMRAARVNMTFVGLAYRASSALVHGSVALSDSVAEVGVGDFLTAVRDMYVTPGQWSYWNDYISKNSAEIRHRDVNMDSNVREAIRALSEKQGFLEDIQKFGFHMLAYSDQLSARPTWLAAFRQEVGKGLSPAEAMSVADKRVRQAHGASAPIDLPAIQRGGGGFWHEAGRSTAGMFLSFMNHAYNRLWSITRQFGRAGEQAKEGEWAGARRDFSDALARSIFYTIAPAIAVTAIRGVQHRQGVKDLHSWIDGVAHTTVGSIPFAGMVLDMVEGREQSTPLGQATMDTGKTAANAWHAAHHDGHVSARWLQQAINTAGYWTGKIPGQAGTSGQYLWDFSTGKEHPKDALDFARGLAFGPTPKKGH